MKKMCIRDRYNIYRLPDLNDFDGIIVDLNNIRYPKVREYVISSAKATGKPVISIANEIADFYYVGIDNYSAMQEMVAHLYEVHGCRRFWYVMGPDDNYESNRRCLLYTSAERLWTGSQL